MLNSLWHGWDETTWNIKKVGLYFTMRDTLSPIMEVENSPQWKETNIGGTHWNTSMIVGRKVKKLRKNPSSKKMRFIRLSEKVRNGITSSPKKHLQTFQVQVDWPNLPTVKGATKRCYQFSSKTWTIPNGYPLGFNISTVKHKNPVGKELHLFFQFLDGLFCFVFAIFCFPAKTWLSQ